MGKFKMFEDQYRFQGWLLKLLDDNLGHLVDIQADKGGGYCTISIDCKDGAIITLDIEMNDENELGGR
jgi:hypothetical protein